ncbi:hypothetical protein Mapa_001395 [Marchantia paleacea]|nr:hypothetical protein Mapa_001395 [Marchantia paleacea]
MNPLSREQAYSLSMYDSCLKKSHDCGRFSMELLAENLAMNLIVLGKIGQIGLPVVLIGDNLGGLVIKKLCLYVEQNNSLHKGWETREGPLPEKNQSFENFLQRISEIFYFATPHQGLIISADRTQLDGEVTAALEIFSSKTAQLNDDFSKLRANRNWKTSTLGPGMGNRDVTCHLLITIFTYINI